jgi:hypothetical protein
MGVSSKSLSCRTKVGLFGKRCVSFLVVGLWLTKCSRALLKMFLWLDTVPDPRKAFSSRQGAFCEYRSPKQSRRVWSVLVLVDCTSVIPIDSQCSMALVHIQINTSSF